MRTSAFGRSLILTLLFASCIWLVADAVMACEYPVPDPCQKKPCKQCNEDSKKCEDVEDTCECDSPCGIPKLKLVSRSAEIRIDDLPMAFASSKGPGFAFQMTYASRDTRNRTARTWPVGYRWSHSYETRIVMTNANAYEMQFASGRGPAFTVTGTNFVWDETYGLPGMYDLAWQGSNIVARKAVWSSLTPRRSGCKSCSSCGTKKDAAALDVSALYAAWHASEGMTFEPDPVITDTYRLARITGPCGNSMTLHYDASSCITSIVDAASNTFLFAYSASGHLTNVTDVTGNRHVVMTYSNDLFVSITDMGGQTFQYGYNTTNGFLTSFKQPSPAGYDETRISYDGDYSGATKVTITHPQGNQGYVNWDGNQMQDNLTGLGEKTLLFETYSWGKVLTESRDPLGRITSSTYYDNTNAALKARIWRSVKPDGTSLAYEYDSKGTVAAISSYDNVGNLQSKELRMRAYFPGTACPSTVTNEVQDANGNVLSRDAKEYSRFDNGTTNDPSDDVYTLISEKRWISSNAYAETRYVYDTNTWLLAEVRDLVSGTNNYCTIKTFAYNDNYQVTSISDALTNTTSYAYDTLARVTNITSVSSAGLVSSVYFYDNLDRLTNLVHPDGISESWTHNPCGCGTATHVDRGGSETVDTLNSNKWLKTRITTTTNNTDVFYEEYLYNSAGSVTGVVNYLGDVRRTEYNSANEITKSIDQLNRETLYLYDSAGRQYKTIYPDGTVSMNTYDTASRLVKVTRHANIWTTNVLTSVQYGYAVAGRQVTITDALGNVTSNAFNMRGRIVKVTYPDGSFAETEYDLHGNVVKQVGPVPPGATQPQKDAATTSNSYDVLNRLVATVDPEGRTITYEYDVDWPQQVARVRNDNGQIINEGFYDAFTGRLLTNIVDGVRMVYQYDGMGQVTRTVFADDSYSENSYDGPRLISQRSRTGNVTTYSFNALGRVASVTNPRGAVTSSFYDKVGNQTNVVDALTNRTSYVYDNMNRMIRTVLPDGRVATNTYDALGRFTTKTGAGSVPAFYEYDVAGRMTALIDGMTNRTTFAYDALNRLTKKTYADGTFYSYGHNARGWLTNRLDAMARNTRYSYNNVGQMTKEDYPINSDVLYSYDNLGRMTSRVDAAGTWAWTYDGESLRVLSETLNGLCHSAVNYAYDPTTFDLVKVALDTTNYTEYTWQAGRITDVTWYTGVDEQTVHYGYKSNSDLLEETAFSTANSLAIGREYDALDRLTRIYATNAAGVINSFAYTLDATDRRIERSDADNAETTWKYDSYDQLTNAVRSGSANGAADAAYRFGYTYDQVGNRLHESRGQLDLTGTHNQLNQLTHRTFGGKLDVVGSATTTNLPVSVKVDGALASIYGETNYLGGARVQTGSNVISVVAYDATSNRTESLRYVTMPPKNPELFTYDLNGNMTSDGQRVLIWDEENRLVVVETSTNVADSDRRRSEYTYDAQGRRVERKDMSGWLNGAYSATTTTCFVWDEWLLLAEIEATGTTKAYHVYGPDLFQTLQESGGIGGLLARVEGVTNHLYTYDGNGNVADLINVNGDVVGHYDYDPFGNTVGQFGMMAQSNPLRFSTKYFEPNWNLYYYGYRYYVPGEGKWLGRDPIEENGGFNLYSFCFNSPFAYVDTWGDDPKLLYPHIKPRKPSDIRPPSPRPTKPGGARARFPKLTGLGRGLDAAGTAKDIMDYSLAGGVLFFNKECWKLRAACIACRAEEPDVCREKQCDKICAAADACLGAAGGLADAVP